MVASTPAGEVILFHFIDWGWTEMRKESSANDFNQQLMRGSDGCIFIYDICERRSKSDHVEFNDWYSRACGFERPQIIVSNKNDSKKVAVTDAEGKALAAKGDRRGYVAISLVEDTGIDEFCSTLLKIMCGDLNVNCTSYRTASSEALAWSQERSTLKMSSLGLGQSKTKRVMLCAMNSAVIEKFSASFAESEFVLEAVSSPEELEEMLAATAAVGESSLPIVCIMAPPTASGGQIERLRAIAQTFSSGMIVSIPKSALDGVREAGL